MSKCHYVNGKKFSDEVSKYTLLVNESRARGERDPPPIPDYLADCILKMCTNLTRRYPFSYQQNKHDDMIGDGLEDCIKCLYDGSFDVVKGQAFSYFSRIIWHAFDRRIAKENKQIMVLREIIKRDSKVDINTDTLKTYMDRTEGIEEYFNIKREKLKEQQKRYKEKKKKEEEESRQLEEADIEQQLEDFEKEVTSRDDNE